MNLKQPHKHDGSKRLSPVDDLDGGDVDEIKYNDKMKVECICPKCGQKHIMTFHWIGRGIPRKYCPVCKVNN